MEIKSIFRKYLKEEINDTNIGSLNIPVIFVVVNTKNVTNIFNVGFDRVFLSTHGTMFGDGVYSSYYLNGARRLWDGDSYYGGAIIMAKIPEGFKGRYLIYTEHEAKYVYGQDYRLEDQLKYFTNDINIINRYKNITAYEFGKHHQDFAKRIGIHGIIYDWNSSQYSVFSRGGDDGGAHVCVLPFNFKEPIPFKVCYDNPNRVSKRDMKFEKVSDNIVSDARKRMDPYFHLRERYSKNSLKTPVYIPEYNGFFVPVEKGYNRWNMVEMLSKDMHEISPYDFQSISKLTSEPNKDDGHFFTIEYNNIIFKARPWYEDAKQGIFLYNGEWYTFDDLPNISKEARLHENVKRNFKKYINESQELLYQNKYSIPSVENFNYDLNHPISKDGSFLAYTATDPSSIPNIFKVGFSRAYKGTNDQRFSGEKYSWYGDGVYCKIGADTVSKFEHNGAKYGAALMKVSIIGGFDRFLIFHEGFAKQQYGSNFSIKSQVYSLFPHNIANEIWADMESIMRLDSLADYNHHFDNRGSGMLLQYMLRPSRRGIESKIKYEKLFAQYNIRGVIYYGHSDGLCIVPYDFNSVIPIGVYNPFTKQFENNGQIVEVNYGTPKKTNFSFNFDYTEVKEKLLYGQDVEHKFKHKFKEFSYSLIKGPDIDGNMTTYQEITTFNNEKNYVNANSGEKISPIDFEYVTKINPNDDYKFNFGISKKSLSFLGIKNINRINQMDFNAIPYAFMNPLDEEWYTFDELGDILKNIDINITNSVGNKQIDLNNPLGNAENL